MLEADLRAEPIVFCVPDIEKNRYYTVQLTDMYTFNYGYVGSRATDNIGDATKSLVQGGLERRRKEFPGLRVGSPVQPAHLSHAAVWPGRY
jgi:hypothetical protein